MTLLDQWTRWLGTKRHGGNTQALQQTLHYIGAIRDQLIARAQVMSGDVVLDAGCGDGLLGVAVLQHYPDCQVIFSDVASGALQDLQAFIQTTPAVERCRFVAADLADLSQIDDAAVDVVLMRSVLMYVADKQAALRAVYRVLRAGGRLSLHEPINRFSFPEPDHLFWGYDVRPIAALAARVKAAYAPYQNLDAPQLNYDEYHLLQAAESAGFAVIQSSTEVSIVKPVAVAVRHVADILAHSPSLEAPTLQEVLNTTLSTEESQQFIAHLRPLVTQSTGESRTAQIYLFAMKRNML